MCSKIPYSEPLARATSPQEVACVGPVGSIDPPLLREPPRLLARH